jgi:hypothetical protein
MNFLTYIWHINIAATNIKLHFAIPRNILDTDNVEINSLIDKNKLSDKLINYLIDKNNV